MPRKQRHTAKRIWQRLVEAGFTGGYTVVKDAVRELTQKNQEVFVPLIHRPGEAQVDFGHALAKVNGQLRKVAFFVMVLPYSDATFEASDFNVIRFYGANSKRSCRACASTNPLTPTPSNLNGRFTKRSRARISGFPSRADWHHDPHAGVPESAPPPSAWMRLRTGRLCVGESQSSGV